MDAEYKVILSSVVNSRLAWDAMNDVRVMAHASKLNSGEAETGGLQIILGQPVSMRTRFLSQGLLTCYTAKTGLELLRLLPLRPEY